MRAQKPMAPDRFVLVFVTVLFLTVLCAAGATWIAFTPPPASLMASELFATFNKLLVAGMGAMLGLLGGKAL
jgi:hypothetical protein